MRASLRFAILERDGFKCRYCGASGEEIKLHVDHIISRRDGGSDHPSNLVTACETCNLGKAARSIRDERVSRRAVESLIKFQIAIEERALEYLRQFVVQHHCGCELEREVADYLAEADSAETAASRDHVIEIVMRSR